MKPIQQTDDVLLLRLTEGDEEAFEYLFCKYTARLQGFAKTFIGDEAVAEDIVQESFMKIWMKRSILKNISLSSLLFSIVRNGCINYLKRQALIRMDDLDRLQANEQLEALYCMDLYGSADHKMLIDELREQIERAIDQLPERTQLIYRLSRNEGMKNRDISQQLHISINSVEKHIRKAITLLADHFQSQYPADITTLIILMIAF
jgi:RNA polymerase sigma-70 factor (family 1)